MPIPLLEPSVMEVVRRIRRRVLNIDGVRECDVRMDSPGKKPHVSVHLLLEANSGYEATHGISSSTDHEVRRVVPNARVTIRSEPDGGGRGVNQSVWELTKRIADDEPGSRGAHNIHLQNLHGKLGVDFHLEVGARMTVKQAHDVAARIEQKLKAANPRISEVVIHEETISERVSSERRGHGSELKWYIDHVMRRFPEAKLARSPVIRRIGEGELHVVIRVSFSPEMRMDVASQVMSKLGATVRNGYPKIMRLDVVSEPQGETGRVR